MSERRVATLFVLLLLAQLVVLALQVPSRFEGSRLLDRLALRLVAPIPRAIDNLGELLASAKQRLATARDLRRDNRRLKRENEQLHRALMQAWDLENQLRRLTDALEYSRSAPGSLVAADVVYADYSSWFRTLLIYVGATPVQANQPVLSPAGLVGRVVLVAGSHAKVQLITDRAAGVGGMIERTRRQGVVRGNVEGALELAYVPLQADVRTGDKVVTAGIDGIYPRGIPIGEVTQVDEGPDLFHRIRLTPAVDLGTLDQVYVLASQALPQELKEAQPGASP